MQAQKKETIQEKLKQIFGHEEFREEQEAIIKNVLDRKNTFVTMPTGGGKSLCYQIPALMQDGVAIIVSPLIALMKNQVDQLCALGVNAAFLNSTISKKGINAIKEGVLANEIKLLYVAPESLIKQSNLDFLKQAKVSFIAVDEVHCISDWGHDFRPEYRRIKLVLDQQLGALPIIALTATATLRVQQDILKNLQIEDATLFKTSFNRSNLYYEVRPKTQVEKELVRFIKGYSGASGIVYCQSRKKVEEIATLLNVNGVKAVPYHAGLEAKVRVKNQDAFLTKKIEVVVATIAFGMGIDKPDVRFVVHHDIPRSLEGYYQETGRAGRDDLESICLMFYSYEDVLRLEKLNKSKPAGEREKAKFLLGEMADYSISGVCRRKQLFHYFGEAYEGPCNRCDNCKHPTATYAGEEFVKMVLEAVRQTQEKFDTDHIIRFLRGIEDPYIKSYHQKLDLFGHKSEKGEAFWKSVIRQAQLLDLLSKGIDQIDILKVTEKGKYFLDKPYTVELHEDNVYDTTNTTAKHTEINEQHDIALFKLLKALRAKVAQEKGIPEYAILQDSSLKEMALFYPTTLEELARINGLSIGKAQKFGLPFLEVIHQHVEENDITPVSDFLVRSKADNTKNKVYIIQQVDRKIRLEELADARSLSMEELLKEMEQICYSGTKLNLDYYINTILTKSEQREIYDYFMQAETDRIKEAQEARGGNFEEEELRLMRIKFLSEVAN